MSKESILDYELHQKTNERQMENRQKLYKLYNERPLPDDHILTNLGLYMRSSALAKVLFLDEMFGIIRDIPGKIIIFGLWWGQDAIILENLRAIREPYNHSRKIVGFDTFEGYPQIGDNDKASRVIKEGGYSVTANYLEYLNELASYHENENIMSNIKKIEFIKGDVKNTVPQYFADHPETVVAMAYFDMALYEPTKLCLSYIKEACFKGSIIVLDELNDSDYPGETVAVKEVFDLNQIIIKRSHILPDRTYIEFR